MAWKEKDKGGGGVRSAWLAYINESLTPARLATSMIALERSLQSSFNASAWMGEKRNAWVSSCKGQGGQWDAIPFK